MYGITLRPCSPALKSRKRITTPCSRPTRPPIRRLYAQWQAYHSKELPEALLQDDSLFAADKPTATRASSGTVLNKLNQYLPNLFGGSAGPGSLQ